MASKLGIGADVGLVYEWRPDWKKYKYDMDGKKDMWMRDKNKYKLKAGIAINDIGGMKYDKGGESNNFNINVKNFDLTQFDDIEGFRSLDSVLTSFQDSGYVTIDSDDDRIKKYEDNIRNFIDFAVDKAERKGIDYNIAINKIEENIGRIGEAVQQEGEGGVSPEDKQQIDLYLQELNYIKKTIEKETVL